MQNISSEHGRQSPIAIAAEGLLVSNGNAVPSWEDVLRANQGQLSRPTVKAETTLVDDLGNSYRLTSIVGLRLNGSDKEWTTLSSGGSIPVAFEFKRASSVRILNDPDSVSPSGTPCANQYSFSAVLWVSGTDDHGQVHVNDFQVYFPAIPR